MVPLDARTMWGQFSLPCQLDEMRKSGRRAGGSATLGVAQSSSELIENEGQAGGGGAQG